MIDRRTNENINIGLVYKPWLSSLFIGLFISLVCHACLSPDFGTVDFSQPASGFLPIYDGCKLEIVFFTCFSAADSLRFFVRIGLSEKHPIDSRRVLAPLANVAPLEVIIWPSYLEGRLMSLRCWCEFRIGSAAVHAYWQLKDLYPSNRSLSGRNPINNNNNNSNNNTGCDDTLHVYGCLLTILHIL